MNDQRTGLVDLRAGGTMMTVIEVAAYLKVHKITIYRTIKAGGKLGQLKIGRVWRFSRDDVERFAEGRSDADLN